ncbi:MAG: response regulator [Rhodocyclaceae bacterium]|nr:response regulator [Rhodocyclaceae bacterium]
MPHSKKILIVEDEEILAENLLAHLQRCGWEARIASTGRQAIATAGAFLPQVILLDYHLPDIDGFQALAAIRHAHGAGDCILMTGHSTDAVTGGARRHGIRHILSKPFSLAELRASLAAVAGDLPSPAIPFSPAGERRRGERRQGGERRRR